MEEKTEKQLIERFVKIVTNSINGKTEKVQISQAERLELCNLLQEFKFLYCYPNDNQFFNIDILNNAVKNNSFIIASYYPNTEEYNKLMQNDEIRQNLTESDKFVVQVQKNKIEESLESEFLLYEKNKDGVINQYKLYTENEKVLVEDRIDAYLWAIVPMVIKGKDKDDLLNSKHLDSKNENLYYFSLNSSLFSYKWNHELVFKDYKKVKGPKLSIERMKQRLIADVKLEYILIGDELIYKRYYDTQYYQAINDIQKKQLRMFVVDENGNELNINDFDSTEIIHDIRTAIAHCRVYDYKIDIGQYFIMGKTYLIIKEQDGKEIKRAIFCSSEFIKFYADCNCYNNPDKKEFHCIFAPKVQDKITTTEKAEEFENKCNIVSVMLSKDTDFNYVEEVVKPLLNKYKTQNIEENLDEFLTNNLNEIFTIKKINIEKIANEKFLEQKFSKNEAFYELPYKKSKFTQQSFVEDILANYYEAKELTAQWQKSTREEKKLKLKPYGVGRILDNLTELVEAQNKNLDLNQFAPFQAYKSEVYYVLCMVVAYNNLVRNGFIENFEYKNLKVKIDGPESYERKLKSENMNEFRFYGLTKKHKGEGNVPKSTNNDKIDIIRWIRNGICHSGVFIRFDGSNNYEDNFFYFVNDNEDKEKEIEGQRKPDNVVRVRCKDLMEFAMRPLFANYKYKEKVILNKSFDDVVKNGVEILKKYPL